MGNIFGVAGNVASRIFDFFFGIRSALGRACVVARERWGRPNFNGRDIETKDIWLEISLHLNYRSIIQLSCTSKWFKKTMMDDEVWMFITVRDLGLPLPDPALGIGQYIRYPPVAFPWVKIYPTVFDQVYSLQRHPLGGHHVLAMRVGSYLQRSPTLRLMGDLNASLDTPPYKTILDNWRIFHSVVLESVKPGIWIADLHCVDCMCNNYDCHGITLIFDARHIELFLNPEYELNRWQYQARAWKNRNDNVKNNSGGIFDSKYLSGPSNAEIFDRASWVAVEQHDSVARVKRSMHALAYHVNVMGDKDLILHQQFYSMRSPPTEEEPRDEVVGLRMSSCILPNCLAEAVMLMLPN